MDLKLWMVFEAVAPEKDKLDNAIEDHLEKLESEKGVEITESTIEETEKVENPAPGLEEGYSKIAEVKVRVTSFARAIKIVINYGPTYVQMDDSKNQEIKVGDIQESLQEVANMMHRYAQQGLGGVLVSNPEADQGDKTINK